MRNRRLTWLLTSLLALGALHATPVTRTAPLAQIRSAACRALKKGNQKSVWPEKQWLRIAGSEPKVSISGSPDEFSPVPASASPYRFQLPPPATTR
ncbi:MAG: hypothetical protein M3Z09_07505 [Acidobacteriota bacterium]|nr:hypothetical protein [Acidobacteriota bacterium]